MRRRNIISTRRNQHFEHAKNKKMQEKKTAAEDVEDETIRDTSKRLGVKQKGRFARSVSVAQATRDNSENQLNKFIKGLQADIKKLPEKQRLKPDAKLLTKHFSPKQRRALWMRLSKARGKEDMTITQAWAALAYMEVNQKAVKNEVLFFD